MSVEKINLFYDGFLSKDGQAIQNMRFPHLLRMFCAAREQIR